MINQELELYNMQMFVAEKDSDVITQKKLIIQTLMHLQPPSQSKSWTESWSKAKILVAPIIPGSSIKIINFQFSIKISEFWELHELGMRRNLIWM